MYRRDERGFTLIELLIVIVIIGILSGILISVIDPVRQQNRSKNASIKAAINKASFAVNTARAGMGRLPADTDLQAEMENTVLDPLGGGTCTETDALNCLFSLAGANLPATCGANGYGGNGTTQCYFWVEGAGNLSSSHFRLMARKWQLDSTDPLEEYVFDSSRGFYECPEGYNVTDFTVAIDDTSTGCTAVSTD